MDVFAQIMNAVMKASVWDGDEQDDRITAGLLQKAFNLGRLSQKDGNFVPFNDMGNNNCGTDGVFILMSHQPVHGGERVSYIGRLPDEATAKKETKADGAIEGTAFTINIRSSSGYCRGGGWCFAWTKGILGFRDF